MSKPLKPAAMLGAVLAVAAVGFGILAVLTWLAATAEASRSLSIAHSPPARLPDHEPSSYIVVDGARLEPSLELTKDYGACRNEPGRCWTQYVAIVPPGWKAGQAVPAWLKCFRGCLGQPWSAGAIAGTLPLTQSLGERSEWPPADAALVLEAERKTGARSEPRACLLQPSAPPSRSVRLVVFLAVFALLCVASGVSSVLCFMKT